MKKFVNSRSTLVVFLVLQACIDTVTECAIPSCAPPNINWLVGIEVVFESQDIDDLQELLLIRYERDQSIPLDTVTLDVSADRRLIIGQGSEIGFTADPLTSQTVEEAQLDYELVLREASFRIDAIEIISERDQCRCPAYRIASLQLNGETTDINDAWAILTL